MSPARWAGLLRSLALIAALVAFWQAIYWWVGDIALASPLATVRYAGRMIAGGAGGSLWAADVEWQAADHPLADSFYVWGPPPPDYFVVNQEIAARGA